MAIISSQDSPLARKSLTEKVRKILDQFRGIIVLHNAEEKSYVDQVILAMKLAREGSERVVQIQ